MNKESSSFWKNVVLCMILLVLCLNNYWYLVRNKNKKPVYFNQNSRIVNSNVNINIADHLLCMGITFMKSGNDRMKALANANTATMYYDLRDSVKGFLALPGSSFDGYDIWQASKNELYVNNVETNEFGTPKIRSIIEQVECSCSQDIFFVGYANADIMFDYSLVNTLNVLREWVNNSKLSVLIVGRRWNHKLSTRLSINQIQNVSSDQFNTNAQDYFISTRNFYNWTVIPDFVIGRPAYDNALVDWAYHTGALVDVSETVKALHQTVGDGNSAGHKPNADKDYNIRLPSAMWDHGTTDHAQFKTALKHGVIVVLKTTNGDVVWPVSGAVYEK